MNELDQKYLEIWKIAKPYYENGRSYDVPHIEWMMDIANKITEKESLDKEILLPLCILHDIGYSGLGETNPNIKGRELKIKHMEQGSKMARTILQAVKYDKEKTEKIVKLISVHDNWVLGDNSPFKESKEMAVFNDLDFFWPWSSYEQFKTTAASMEMTPVEADKYWETDEKLTQRPLCCESTIKLFEEYKSKIKRELYERTRRN